MLGFCQVRLWRQAVIYGAVVPMGMPEMLHSRIFRKEEWGRTAFNKTVEKRDLVPSLAFYIS